jgi:hypothetical protein
MSSATGVSRHSLSAPLIIMIMVRTGAFACAYKVPVKDEDY